MIYYFAAYDFNILSLKMPSPISQNGNLYSNDASSPKISWFQISFKSVKLLGHKKRLRILLLRIPYCVSLIMVTITSHIFINIFQTVHFSAVKFTKGNEKNMSFLLIPKSLKVWEKSEAIGLGTFNSNILNLIVFCLQDQLMVMLAMVMDILMVLQL